ncbi:MAG TPA: diguanylate cyclase, partial [Pseudomonadales bacterium]|nr:diguanylate cyclase [Pseudomonadales bacterium]
MIMPSLKSLSIRKKVLLIAMMTSLIGLMIAGTIFVVLNRQTTRQEMIDELNIIAKVLANRSKAALEFSDTKLANDNLESVRVHPTVQNACLYDLHGALFASFTRSGSALKCKPQPPKEVTSFTARHFVVQVPVNLDDEQIGTLSVTSDVSRLDSSTTRLGITMAITMSIVSLVTYLLGMRLQTLVTRPIKLLGDTAQQVAESNDYTTRAPKQNDDELGRLISAFNRMMDKIEHENLALSASEKRFRTLTDYSPVGIFQTDPGGQLLYVNDRFTEITGVPAENISLSKCDELLRLDDGGSFSERWLHAVGSLDEFLLAFRPEHNPAQVITVIGQAMPLYDAQANVIGYLGSLTDVTELKTAQLKLEQLAFFDPLTHLANRRLMTDCIEEELRNLERNGDGGQFALLILDLDQFKRVNDSMGHDAGDLLLTMSAERLQSCVRKSDIVGRFGGDEFLILVRDISGPETPKHIAENILRVLREPISIGSQQIIVTSSIGITVGPIDGNEVRTLIKNADLAMYRAKAEGRDGYQFFSEDMNKRIQEELEIERELRSAIELEQFVLYFQPQIDMISRKMVGLEALVRWIHPVKGLISPDRFIPVAEDTGLIVPLGKLLIKQACR